MPAFMIEAANISGGQEIAWTDPPGSSLPSRLNPNPQHPHSYRLVTVPGTLVIQARVDGVLAPLDANPVMAGRTFSATIARWSGTFPPVVTQTAGQSSEITVQLGADNLGHHLLLVTLSDNGGSIGVPFDGT